MVSSEGERKILFPRRVHFSFMQPLRCACFVPLFLAICAGLSLSQDAGRAQPPLVGCYEVTSLKWTPPAEDPIKSPLERFELSSEPDRSTTGQHGPFRVHSLTRNDPWERLWNWRPSADGQNLRINLSHGLGGFRGAFHVDSNGELVGKVKEYCDHRCDWKRQTAHIRARKIPCAPAEK